ncbi:hypothetical protein [Amantichitinum ursilacus]|uniref:Uncharacterized protein n=1 Tax=Amantichitinum ursilacus TaxID=857265 RepID=A0A0N0GNM1_9NEIS|nr:hypothetical protein [Amantichitinum ursilacus]KPC52962.1 hypothetical protein WG78_10745 [Amantichitinum ursilacus]
MPTVTKRRLRRAAAVVGQLPWLGLALADVLVLVALLEAETPGAQVIWAVGHVSVSAVLVAWIWRWLLLQWEEERWHILMLLVALAVFLPAIGPLGLAFAAALAQQLPERREVTDYFRVLPAPEFTLRTAQREVRYGVGGVRARLADPLAPSNIRLNALLTLKSMPQRLSSNMLRDLLDDPEEDLRLLAYGMLDQEEKRINAQINEALTQYQDPDARAPAAQRLAFLYWEQIYHGMAQGDLRRYALEQSALYLEEALAALPNQADLWMLRGKLFSAQGKSALAREAYQQASLLGFPLVRLIPYLAEHSYYLRDFEGVRAMLNSLHYLHVNDTLQPVARYWRKAS